MKSNDDESKPEPFVLYDKNTPDGYRYTEKRRNNRRLYTFGKSFILGKCNYCQGSIPIADKSGFLQVGCHTCPRVYPYTCGICEGQPYKDIWNHFKQVHRIDLELVNSQGTLDNQEAEP